ncbi:MAG: putative photosynthetic complex assembly protein PuhE [Ahrensia sp.]|nr:putative photosynthetic complex assembly protein PuhE [Ahrensia sp.]
MSLTLTAILAAIMSWWFATGAIILVARWGQKHELVSMTLMSFVGAAGLFGLYQSASDNSVMGVYHAFASALAVWAWHEAAFLLGVVTGPRKIALSEGASGLTRFKQAYETIRDHEFSLFVTLFILVLVLTGSQNHMGLLTFALMWIMRLSTKLNVFLGAPNAVSEILPKRLSYLTSYFCTNRISPFFWYSMTFTAALFFGLVGAAMNATQDSALVGLVLLGSFAALAVIEHLFLVLPIRDADLWAWFLPTKKTAREKIAVVATSMADEFNVNDNINKPRIDKLAKPLQRGKISWT